MRLVIRSTSSPLREFRTSRAEVAPALESFTVDELRKALNDPVGFLETFDPASVLNKLEKSMGPEAKRFVIAKLRLKLTKELHKQGFQWEEA